MSWGPFPINFTTHLDAAIATESDPTEEERLAEIQPNYRMKGMFFLQTVGYLSSEEFEHLRPSLLEAPLLGKYLPFSDYPTRDLARIEYAMLRKVHPALPLREGLRRNGYHSVETFASSSVGKMLVGLAGSVGSALERLPSALAVTNPQGRVFHQRISNNEAKLRFMDFPGWVDAGLIGTLEALCVRYGVMPVLEVSLRSPSSAEVHLYW